MDVLFSPKGAKLYSPSILSASAAFAFSSALEADRLLIFCMIVEIMLGPTEMNC